MHTRETSMLNSRRDVHVAFHGGNEPTNRPRYELFRDKNQTDDIFSLFSRFPRCKRGERGAASAARLAPLPVFRSLERPTNLEPTFRDNLARPFSTPAHGNGLYRERTFRAVHFDSSNRHRTCRRYEMFTRGARGRGTR